MNGYAFTSIHIVYIYIYCIYVDRYQRGSTIEGPGDHPSSLTEVRPAVLAWYLQVLYTLTDLPTGFLIVNQHKRRKLMVNLALKHWDISKCLYMYTIYTYYIYIIYVYIYIHIWRKSCIYQQILKDSTTKKDVYRIRTPKVWSISALAISPVDDVPNLRSTTRLRRGLDVSGDSSNRWIDSYGSSSRGFAHAGCEVTVIQS